MSTRVGDFEKLSPAKQKLLLARLRKREEAEQRAEGIPRSPRRNAGEKGEPFPLSFAQQRLWFIDRMVPGTSVYNVADALLLEGRLDVPALERTLGAIVERHETLRTVFDVEEGRPIQRILPPVEGRFPIPVTDLSGLGAERAEAEARRLTEAEAVLPFDVPHGPHLRARLVRLGTGRHVALLSMHHIVSDGWSMGVLVRELEAFYRAFAGGEPAVLPVLPIQYPDFADWQRRTLQGEVLDEHIRWWRERLAGAPPTLDLPADHPRPPVQRHRGAALRDLLPSEVSAQAGRLAQERGGTPFMVLLATLALHLARHAGQDDVVVGSPVANRNRLDTEGLIGFFVNTLVLRVDAGERPGRTFLDLLDEVRRTTLGAYAHQDLPFERIVEELKPERDLSRSPLYQVAFALQNAPVGDLELPGLTLAPMPLPPAAAVVDLSLEAVETPEGIAVDWRYDVDLFEASTVRRMAERFGVLLRAAVAEPARPLEDLPLLAAEEREQVLVAWSSGPRQEEAPLFPEWPGDSPALFFGEEVWTYTELAARAGGLARRLLALEAGPETRAGICLERSPDLIASVLAALSAGMPFVPLDPGYPADRLAYMASDAGIAVLLTTRALADRVALPAGARTLLLDEIELDEIEETLPDVRFDPDRLAYVLYTSGSTGRPKGVMVPHRGLVNLAAAQRSLFGAGPRSRVLQFASPSFDASIWEVTMALGAGAALRLAPREALLPGPDFARHLAEWGITHAILPPSALAVTPSDGLPDFACVIAGGEACPPAVAARWAPGRLFVNAYGPTEGTVCATAARSADTIGRPLPGVEAFVVDRLLRPAPVGVPGELWIGGAGVARGYRGRPDLTAERFVPHPFAAIPGARLYRTGDLVRWRPDGQLDFLGRIDRQVKIRGVRIEPGEIEGVLAEHPEVQDAAVAVRHHAGGPRLAAWVVLSPESQIPISALRAWAAEHLPEALVPSAFAVVPEMPLTPAGKVDRDALPDPESPSAAAPPAAPRAGLESTIAGIWREVLGLEQVGRAESFFDLGGHSLLLVEVQSRLRDRLGRDIPILDLFRYSDIASLARHLSGETEEAETLVPIRERPASTGSRDIAVIGLACRFPEAPSPEAFWANLRAGVEAIRVFSVDELRDAGVDPALLADPAYVRASGVLDEADLFDAPFFDISPREAQILDPQHRVLLECAAEALERAGHGAGSPALSGQRVGVFAGTGMSVYGISVASVPGVDGFEATLGNDKDFIATRLAYELDLRGPAICVQTACSTSLVAVHLACKALLDGECELALAGGVTIQFPQVTGYLWREGGITSPDGHNRAFDARAQGTVGGNGAGIVVLKPLSAALADGDRVHAVIKATALNNDGSEKIGFTAPSERGEAEVIAEAQVLAGVPPETIGYVEAHGSATPLGDPIEVAALMRAFRARASSEARPSPVALGSVKTNIGHTGSAAGVAGLIKTVLALKHREIPPSLWFETPNPRIDFAAGPFQVATALTPWEPPPGVPRRAGVSSFGLGGTNAHAIVEEGPETAPSGPGRSRALIALSARTPTALESATDRLASHLRGLQEQPDLSLADVSFTLLTGRKAHEHRRIVVATDASEAAVALAERDPRRVLSSVTDGAPRAVAFVLAGLGEQYPGLSRGLYEEEPVFREELDRCAELLAPRLGVDIREALFAKNEERGSGGLDLRRMLGRGGSSEAGPLDRTEVLQPALFAVEYALARLWMAWGIAPAALIGYSLGEYVAACLADVFSLEEALRLVAERARWIGGLPAGAMLAVPLPEAEIRPWIERTGLDLAATNGPRTSVVSGAPEAVEDLERRLAEAGHPARRLRTTHAFHSRAMGPAAERLIDLVREIGPRPPRIPLLSNVTGTWMTGEQAADPRSWAEHLLRPVRFAEGIAALWSEPGRILLEIGPGQSLSSLALQHPAAAQAAQRGDDPVALPSLPSAYESRHDLETVLGTLGKLWLAGVAADWPAVWAREDRRRVELPTYPFERQRYWLQGEPGMAPEAPALPSSDLDRLTQETEALLATVRSADLAAIQAQAENLAALVSRLRGGTSTEPPSAAISSHPRPGLRNPYVEPVTELERMVTSLWQRLLGIDRIGRHDSFFDLGGDSLLATQALTRVRDAFGVDIPLPSLFEDPTPAGIAALIERLRGGADNALRETIPRQPRDGRAFPTSFAQERLWVIDQIEPGSIAYNLPTSLRLSGRLRIDLLERVFAEIVRRHETLRTTFAPGGPPLQVIQPPAPVPVPLLDLTVLPSEIQEIEVRRLAIEEGSAPFNLSTGPVLRIRLLRLAAEEHALLLTLHHIASDGWSSGVLVQEIAALYDAFAHGRPSPLPELAVQYADYAVWQRQAFQGPEIAASLDWWRYQLADAPVLELPTDRPRPAVQGTGGSFVHLQMPGRLAQDLEALARPEGATLFMVVAAAFQALLARLSGQDDLTVGTPVANRHHSEVEGLIGFFVNTLVLRTDLSGDPPFRPLLARVRRVALEALEHGQVPFSQVVEAIRPERSLSHTPLFQVMVQLANAPGATLEIPGLRFGALDAPLDSAMFDLNLTLATLAETPDGLSAILEYRTDLFDRTTAQRLLERYAGLLEAIAARPEMRVSELPLLTEGERQAVVVEWPLTLWLPLPPPPTLPGEGEIALLHNGQAWTFREIHDRSARLAAHLQGLGIGPGSRVGIFAERSREMVEAVLATLMAGAAYVPLDPAYPAERLAFMQEDAGVAVVLTRKDVKDLNDLKDTEQVSSSSFESFSSFRSFDLASSPDDLAYVIYTSGSTGRPKGVAMTRGALANLLAWQEAVLPGPARTLQFASLSFDVSFQEIVSTWITGGTLVLVDEETRRDPFALLELLERERVERVFLPFVALRQLAEAAADGDLALRDIVTAGEQLQVTRAVRDWLGTIPGVRLHNQYGPTESHVVTALTLTGDPQAWPSLPSIGRPLPKVPIRVLDAGLQPMPAGVRGELCIGGVALARGYLDRPDLTAERFVPDPLAETPGARLYRTGDLARWRTDGALDYLGRRDHQVKIRGVRVEPGEVEAVLEKHPDVRQAVVLAVPEPGSDALRLVAWYVGASAPADLRAFLQDRLPAAIVPSLFVPLEAFPITPSGKVDRLALSKGYGLDGQTAPVSTATPPRTPTEERLAGLWRELLGVERIGVEDNFFELGGHSLLATQLVSRIRELFHLEIPQRIIFEAPTLEGLALAIDPSSRPAADFSTPIEPVPGDGPFPVSFAQERLWLIDRIERGAAYNLPATLRLTGPLRPEILEAALGAIVERHATLRTTFGEVQGVPVQAIAPPAPFSIPQIDLTDLTDPSDRSDPVAEARRLAAEETLRPFDLARGPVLRALLLRLGAADHALLCTIHHIATDGWSTGIFAREMMLLYDAFAHGLPSPLPALPVRYVDFAVWQRRVFQGDVLAAALDYWRGQLAGVPALDLPTDRPRTAAPDASGALEPFLGSSGLAGDLLALGRRDGATLFMVLMAAFQALLARHTGQTDIAVGTPVAGRDRTELEGLIGFFVNTLVVRTDLSGEPSFREILARVRAVSLAAFAHQQVPFEKLVGELNPERDLARSPLFQVLFVLQNAPGRALEIPGLTAAPFESEGTAAKLDLTLSLAEMEGRLGGGIEYRAALFDAPTIRRLLDHFALLLEGAVADPDRPLAELPLLPESERHQLLTEWSRTEVFPHEEESLGILFARQVEATPDAPALEDATGARLTYRELAGRSLELAHRLRGLGVRPEVPVGISLERSADRVVAALAVILAGGAYVPLDPAHPQERRALILEDTGAPVVIKEKDLKDLRDVNDEKKSFESFRSFTSFSPSALAYLMYTSGSTGRPKGIAVVHRGIARLARWAGDLGIGPGDTVLQLAPFAFDASTLEIWGALLNGARVVVPAPGTLSLEEIGAQIELHRVTVLWLTAGLFHQMVDGALERLAPVRLLLAGGDALSVPHVERLLAALPGTRLVNGYGPTENTTFTACHLMTGPQAFAGSIPLGRPIHGTRVVVLDRTGRPVPVGAPGELCTGGAGLARGYLNRPDLTAASFVPDEDGERLYRTGDLARFLPDGRLEFLGRIDEQVKIRGFRVEPGEIETLLATHPEVRDAAVVVGQDAAGKRLVACVVLEPDSSAAPSDLRAWLGGRLPEPMVPAAFLVLDALPLTPNGKVDRRALARLAPEPAGGGEWEAPGTPAEEALAGLWASVLGVGRVSRHDDFFALGGHSLLATQLVSRIRETFGAEIPLRTLFEAPTLAGLAARIEIGGELVPPITPVPRNAGGIGDIGLLPLSFAQERLWFLDELDPGTPTLNLPFSAWLREPLEDALLARALAEIVRRHEALRTTFGSEGGQPHQRIAPALEISLPVLDLRALAPAIREREAFRLEAEETLLPFDLARGPLVRARIVRTGEAERLFLITLHHIVGDGWSVGLLMRELRVLYAAFAASRPSPLPELPVQYADYAAWQRRWLGGAALETQIASWRRRLGDPAKPLPVLDLPTDRPRPAVQTWRGGSVTHVIEPGLAGRLAALGRRGGGEGATLFMVLLAAFQALLGRLAGQDDVVVGTPVAGRVRAETEGLIGCFLNNLALRTDLSGRPGFRALLGRARDTALEAYGNQDVPFERLLEELRVERDLSRTPLFQVFLNMLNFPTDEGGLGGTDEGMTPDVPSKFDLTIYAGETPAGLRLELVYNADLFDRERMAGLAAQLELLLAQAAEDPERPVEDLSLLTPAALAVLPDPAEPLPRAWPGSLSERVAGHARSRPDAVAATDRRGSWTYAQLDAHANRLARRLRARGVGASDVVSVFAHREAGLAAALLGIWRAGAAFAILDPAYPAARLGAIADLARPRAVVHLMAAGMMPTELLNRLSGLPRLVLPEREPDWAPALDAAAEDLGIENGPDDLAYVAFTSGSTGVPKGILGSHAPLSHFFDWHARTFGLTEDDRFSVLSGLAHDPLLRDLFAPLWIGGTLCVPDPDTMAEPGSLAAWMAFQRITVAHLTPAMGQLLASTQDPALTLPLRRAFFGGDILTGADLERLHQLAPQADAVNFYGATETPQAMGWAVAPSPASRGRVGVGALGRGIDGVQLLVLNPAGHLAGIGELGEIAIRTPYLAQGYLGDPAATAERFTASPDGRLYRTGDLGRYRPDGAVVFAGRADAQVKIRGFRVETGEIEAALARHPAVREAAVILHDDGLLAFVVPQPAGDASGLRDWLRGQLPPYMIPVALVPLERLPLTPNRKVDRRTLARLGAEAVRGVAVATPRSPVEETLAALWGELLGLEPGTIGIYDVFFDLGGHSLLATQLLARVWDTFGVELPLFRLFETPTVAGLAEAVAEALRAGAAETAPALPSVTPVPRSPRSETPADLPLSFGQERLWFLHQLDPESPAYNLPHSLRLTGPLDAAALTHAFREITRRHEILRTRYATVEGVPVQVVGGPPTPLPLVDLSGLPPGAREAEAAACILRDTRAPFDLAVDPPLRARLLRLGAADHALSLTLHHIASDGWSNGLLVREIAELYRAYAAGRPAVLPNLPVQYADFAAWQRRAFASGALDFQRDWWRERLGSPPPPLDLPTDRPRPAVPAWAGASRSLGLPPDLAERVAALGRRRGATLFMTLLAGFATVLSRVSGQDDLIVGSPVAGRSRTEIEGLVGFFVNTLVLRVDLTADPSFADLLGRVREAALGAFVHQDIPFEKLVEELQPERDLAHPPLFQVLFALQNAPAPDLEVSGLGFHRIETGSGAATFDLTLSCASGPEGIGALLQYKTDLFDAPSMDRLLGHFRTLLAAATADPERRLGDLPLLTAPERHQLVTEQNDTVIRRPDDLCLHELFERQVERAPHAVALFVAATGEEITFCDLAARAGRLAAWLQARGVGPEVTVGVSLERSPELIVALLAVLEAGGAWVPLDPAYPPERLAFLIEDSGVSVLLGRESWPTDLPDARPRPSGVTPDHLAYRIYTSGSTGRPKAVLVPHRAIVHHMRWLQEDWPLGPSDVVLQTLSASFDASFFDLWAPLLAGARIILPPPDTARDAARVAEEIARHGVTRLFGVPPWIAELVERPELDKATTVREVFLGGQELPADLARRLRARGWRAVNFYGPSEAAVTATAWPAAPEATDRTVPIGRPLPNVQAHILGAAAEPLPLGVPGELCLGGAGVARGYAGRPDLTAGRFRPDPFGGQGARLYHTGDRARRRPDGVLEFLGRVDRQVKIRGFRIEPGEVEAVLAAHPALRDVAVAARATRGGEARLIAWAVPREPVAVDELRAWLQERLPDPMIPAAWILLDALPLTPNGKVDLAALPEPEAVQTSSERVAPRDALERDLVALWEELLDVRPVGIQDDFFALGGHSLLVLRLLARIEKQLGTRLPPAVLFAAPTIEKLATALREGGMREAGPLVVLSSGGDRPPIVWAHAAAGTVTAYAEIARRLHDAAPDRPVWALQAPADLPATLEELAAGHVAALRAAQPEGPYHLAGWSFGGVVAFEIARQLRKAGAEVAQLALVDTRAPGTQNIPEDQPSLLGAFAADQNLPPDVDPQDIETLRPLFETFQRLLSMLRIYRPEPYPGPITLFRAEERADDLGWSRLAEGGLEIRPLPGNHYTLLHGEALAQALRE